METQLELSLSTPSPKVAKVTEVTEDYWEEMLGALPPEDYRSNSSGTSFYSGEFYSGEVTQHFVKVVGRYFTFLSPVVPHDHRVWLVVSYLVSHESLREAAKYLESWGQRESEGRISNGICLNLFLCPPLRGPYRRETVNWIMYLSQYWEKYSGTLAYPIPDPTLKGGAVGAAIVFGSLPKWEGEYGKLRRELCLFLAQKVNETLDELEAAS